MPHNGAPLPFADEVSVILFKRASFPLLTALALCACSKVNDMHDATMRMDATTAKMAAATAEMNTNTKEMKKQTDNMNGTMCELFDEGRQASAAAMRRDYWKIIHDSKKIEEKGNNAGLYFEAFEFQLWTHLCQDTQAKQLERLELDAVDEFLHSLIDLSHWAPNSVDPFAGSNPIKFWESENEKASFNAIAAYLERNNRKEEEISDGEGISMLTLLENGLRASKQMHDGKAKLSDFPAYVKLVDERSELATRLLVARYQMLGLATLGYETTMTRSLLEGLKFKYLGKSWEIDFAELTPGKAALVKHRLGEAIRDRNLLAELGVTVELNPKLKEIFANGRVKNLSGSMDPMVADQVTPRMKEEGEILDMLKDYTGAEMHPAGYVAPVAPITDIVTP
jgi:hypothetical protein